MGILRQQYEIYISKEKAPIHTIAQFGELKLFCWILLKV